MKYISTILNLEIESNSDFRDEIPSYIANGIQIEQMLMPVDTCEYSQIILYSRADRSP